MSFEPENSLQGQPAQPEAASQTETGSISASDVLLQQIASQLSGLADQVTELKSEVTQLKKETIALKEHALSVSRHSEDERAPVYSGSWKSYDKDDFASDFAQAMERLDSGSWDDAEQPDDDEQSEDSDQDITPEMVKEMEDEYGDMMDEIAAFNADHPADFVQQDPTASTGQSSGSQEQDTVPDTSTEVEVSDSDNEPLNDDEIRKLLADAEAGSTEVSTEIIQDVPKAEEAVSADDGNSRVSDDEIQAMLAQAAEGDLNLPEASNEPQEVLETQVEETQDVAEESEGSARSMMSEDELAELMAEATEAAAEAEPIKPTAPKAEVTGEDSDESDETVEVGFTAFQAGKDVDSDVSRDDPSNADPSMVEEVVERREVIKASFEIDQDVVSKVPAHLAIAALAVPVSATEEQLVCKAAIPIDRASIDLIEDAIGLEVVPEPAPMEEVLDALRTAYGAQSLWTEREAVMDVSPDRYKAKGKKKNFFGRSA